MNAIARGGRTSPPQFFLSRVSLTGWILIALVVGTFTGVFAPDFAKSLAPISTIFLRLIKSIVGPLLFGTLVSGIAASGEWKAMGRIAIKIFIYFEIATTMALVIGLAVGNAVRPGDGVNLQSDTSAPTAGRATSAPIAELPTSALTGSAILIHAIPQNIFEALAGNDVLQLVLFFMLFAVAASAIGEKAKPVVDFAKSVSEIMFRYTKFVMYFAPFGVGAAIAVTVGTRGSGSSATSPD